MNRTITVTGTGKLKLRPDYTVVSLSLKAADMLYDRAMDKAASQQAQLHRRRLCQRGSENHRFSGQYGI